MDLDFQKLAGIDEENSLSSWIFSHHPLGFLLLDGEERIIKANNAFCEMLGYSPIDLNGLSASEILGPYNLQKNLAMARDLHAGYVDQVTWEGSYISAKGEEIFCRSMIKAVLSEEGKLQYCLATILDIRSELQQKSDLQTSQDRWRIVFESTSLGIAIVDPSQFKFVEINQAFLCIVGYERHELLRATPLDISPIIQPDGMHSATKVKEVVKKALIGDKTTFEWHHIHKNGEDRFLEICLDRITIEGQEFILALAKDITARKMNENNLLASQERFRNLYHHNPLMLFTIDFNGEVVAVNQSAIRQLGYSEDELLGKKVTCVFHPEDRDTLQSKIQSFLSSEDVSSSWELRKIKKSGEVIWVREIVTYLDDTDGRSLLISCENITERVLAEQHRKRSEDRYRSIFESNLMAIAITNYEGKFEIVNPTLCQLLGYSESELLGSHYQELTAPIDRKASVLMTDKMRQEMGQLTMEKSYIRKDGTYLQARTFVRMLDTDEADPKLLVVIQDISDEQMVIEQQRQLVAKDDQISHRDRELTSYTMVLTQKNEMLRSIAENLKLIGQKIDNTSLQKDLRRLVQRISQNIDRESTWHDFQLHFQKVNPNFLQNLRTRYPNLTDSELRHCAYVVMHLTTNEVANLLHVTPKAIEIARYRIKKKFGLESRKEKLTDFLYQFV